VLDNPGSSPESGQQIIQWPATGQANQRWHFAQQPGGFYTIQNVASGLFLTAPGGTLWRKGVPLQQQTATHDGSQLWMVNPVGAGYVLSNQAVNLVLDDPGSSPQAGEGIIFWPLHGGPNQRWFIQ